MQGRNAAYLYSVYTGIHIMNLAAVDLNVLLAFEALFEERSVTRAAARVGLTQPAMSNALRRLRALFDDPLFIRKGLEMSPTARAVELAGPVRTGLGQFRCAFDERPQFDPALSARSFRLGLTDYAELLLIGGLLKRIQRSAPEIQIVVRRPVRIFTPPEEDLRAGRLDLAVGFYPEQSALDPSTRSFDLFAEDHVCIARKGHPLIRARFGLKEFAAARHVGIFYRPDARNLVDNILANHGIRRHLIAALPDFLNVPYVVAQSDLIAVVPAGMAAHYGKALPLALHKVPIEFPSMPMRLLWHAHADADAAHQWLRSEIVECARIRRAVRA